MFEPSATPAEASLIPEYSITRPIRRVSAAEEQRVTNKSAKSKARMQSNLTLEDLRLKLKVGFSEHER